MLDTDNMKKLLFITLLFLSFAGVAKADTFQSWLYNNSGLYYPRFPTTDNVCVGCSSTSTIGVAAKLTIEPALNDDAFLLFNPLKSGFYVEGMSPTSGLFHIQNGINGGANEVSLGYTLSGVRYNLLSSIGLNLFTGPTFISTSTTIGASPLTSPTNFSAVNSPGDGDGRYSPGDQVSYALLPYKIVNGQKQFATSSAKFTESVSGVNTGVILTWTNVTGADGYRILSAINNLTYNTYVDCLVASCNGQYLDFLSSAWLSNPTFPNNILTVFGDTVITGTSTLAGASVIINGALTDFKNSVGNNLDVFQSNGTLGRWASTTKPLNYARFGPSTRNGGGTVDTYYDASAGTANRSINTASQNVMYAVPFYAPSGGTINNVYVFPVAGSGVGVSFNCAFYSALGDMNPVPDQLLANVSVPTTANSVFSGASTTITLSPNKLYFAVGYSTSTGVTNRGIPIGSYSTILGQTATLSGYNTAASSTTAGGFPPQSWSTNTWNIVSVAVPSCSWTYSN